MNKRTLTLGSAGLVALVVLLSACEDGSSSSQKQAKALGDLAYKQQTAAVPYPAAQLRDSLERRNLSERLLRENKPNRIQYVYLLGDTGTYIGYYVIKGKVSSNQSQMLPQDEEIDHGSYGQAVVDGPGDDGSFGEDAQGQFFFTTEGTMVSTDMRYIVSDQPLDVNAPKLNVAK